MRADKLYGIVRRLAVVTAAAFCLTQPIWAVTRPIPEFVAVTAFARIDGPQLELLVRVPLGSVKEVQFPTRGDAGYLDLTGVKSMLPGAARYWIANGFQVFDNGQSLARPEVVDTRISLDSDQSFGSYAEATAHLASPELAADQPVFWDHVWLDIRLRYAAASTTPRLSIDPKVADLGVRVSSVLTYVRPESDRVFSFDGNPGLIYLDPTWREAAGQFLRRGARFVGRGAPWLLFLFCLALPFRNYRHIAPAVLLFAVSVFVAILLSRFGLVPDAVWFRPLIATCEAVTILLVAFANIIGRVTPRRRALLALCAGVVFGFSGGFSLAGALQFSGDYRTLAALAFYAGAIGATAAAVGVLVPTASVLFSFARIEYLERIIVSALAADTAWGWLGERWSQLTKVPFDVVFDGGMLAPLLRILAGAVLFAGFLWFVNEWLKSVREADTELATPRAGRDAA